MKESEKIKVKIEEAEKAISAYFDTVRGKKLEIHTDPKFGELVRAKSELKGELEYWERREPKAFCNRHGYTDVYPFEVVRVVSDKCVEVRAMNAKQTKFPKDFHPGGFVGHYADNRSGQDYEYSSNPEAPVERVRWSEANRQWQQGKYIRFVMSDRPYKFYDYNF